MHFERLGIGEMRVRARGRTGEGIESRTEPKPVCSQTRTDAESLSWMMLLSLQCFRKYEACTSMPPRSRLEYPLSLRSMLPLDIYCFPAASPGSESFDGLIDLLVSCHHNLTGVFFSRRRHVGLNPSRESSSRVSNCQVMKMSKLGMDISDRCARESVRKQLTGVESPLEPLMHEGRARSCPRFVLITSFYGTICGVPKSVLALKYRKFPTMNSQ
jgi:hypothetical protein